MKNAITIALLAAACAAPHSNAAKSADAWVYRLAGPSEFVHEHCLPPCACPPFILEGPMRGRWTLIPAVEDGILFTFDVYMLNWSATASGQPRAITGTGRYFVGGIVNAQQLIADLSINGGAPIHFDSGGSVVTAEPPRIEIDPVSAEQGCQQITLAIRAVPTCEADLDGDGAVNFADLNEVLSSFGASGQPGLVRGDANTDGATNFADLNLVLASFGATCG